MEQKTSIIIIGSGSEVSCLQNIMRAMASLEVIIVSEPEPSEKNLEIFPFEKYIVPALPPIDFFQVSQPRPRGKAFREKRRTSKPKNHSQNLRIYCRRKT